MRRLATLLVTSTILLVPPARADGPHAPIEEPLGAGLVRLDLPAGQLVVSPCRGPGCDASKATRVAIEGAATSGALKVIALAHGHVVHAIVPTALQTTDGAVGGRAWEALIVAADGAEPAIVWEGRTGLGDDGEGTRIVERADGVFVGRLRRGVGLCGRDDTMIDPKRVDVASRSLRPVSLLPFDEAAEKAAPKLIAIESSTAPIASVLAAVGASTRDGSTPALTDGDLSTTWSEARAGDGRGEIAAFRIPAGLTLSRLSFVPRPIGTAPDAFVPATEFWISTDAGLTHVSVPSDPAPGARFEVAFAAPLSTRCLSIVLDASTGASDARVGFAEVEGVPVLPSTVHSLDDLVGRLDEDERAQTLAIAVLGGAGDRGALAIARGISSLNDRGRDAAEQLLEAASCAASADGLARLTWDAPKSTRDAAKGAIDGCGAAAGAAIERAFLAGPTRAREALAARFVHASPARALATIAPLLATSSPTDRRTLRAAIAELPSGDAGRAAIAAWLAAPTLPEPIVAGAPAIGQAPLSTEIVELSRAWAPRLAIDPDHHTLAVAIADALAARVDPSASFELRFRAVEAMALLARAEISSSKSWLAALATDRDRYLRARAIGAIASLPALIEARVAGLADADPRVRASALEGDGSAPTELVDARLVDAATSMATSDGWTLVRIAATRALGAVPTDARVVAARSIAVDAVLGKALEDLVPEVRASAIESLVHRGARAQIEAIRARALSDRETPMVRLAAIEALGDLCATSAVGDLTALAHRAGTSAAGTSLGLAAIVALGRIRPSDLADRLAPIDASMTVVRDAVERARRTPAACGR